MARAAGWPITTPTCGAPPRRLTGRPGASGRAAAHGSACICGTITEFSGDKEVLASVYPVLKGAAEFFLDTLVEEPKHKWLVTSPSISPENQHPFGVSGLRRADDGQQIMRDLFANTIQAAEMLGLDEEFRAATRGGPGAAGAEPDRQGGPVAGMAGGLGMQGAAKAASARLASVRALPERAHHSARHAGTGRRRRRSRWKFAATSRPAGPWPGASTCGRACMKATTPTAF